MNCRQAERYLPGYLDGAISPRQHALGPRTPGQPAKLATCNWNVSAVWPFASRPLRRLPPPADLAVRIRMRAVQSGAPWADVRRMWSRAARHI